MLAAVARKDYDDRRRRQAQGILKAKAEGKYRGRPENTDRNAGIAAQLRGGSSWTAIQRAHGRQPSNHRESGEAKRSNGSRVKAQGRFSRPCFGNTATVCRFDWGNLRSCWFQKRPLATPGQPRPPFPHPQLWSIGVGAPKLTSERRRRRRRCTARVERSNAPDERLRASDSRLNGVGSGVRRAVTGQTPG